MNKSENVSIIQVTHDEEMLRSGDRVIQMEDGKIISDQTMDNCNSNLEN